jgi:hypothetical protein
LSIVVSNTLLQDFYDYAILLL